MKTTASLEITSSVLGVLALAGCGKISGLESITTEVTAQSGSGEKSRYDVNLNPLNKLVCVPWGGGGSRSPQKGVKASLFYEYFGLKFETVLKLTTTQEEGDYELAVLSDDGVTIKAQINGQWRTLIDNEGDHPTRMGCARSVINMTRDSKIPLEITYYQGPRYHISNVVMWRKSSEAGLDQECGKTGNNYFFDPNSNSVPLAPYQGLLSRGWSPISSDNLVVPGTENYNPCVEGTNPVITVFRVEEVIDTEVFLGFATDIPSTTQVLITEVATGQQIMTNSDNILRTTHSLRIGGLKPATAYKAQAVAISADLGKAISNEITFRTP